MTVGVGHIRRERGKTRTGSLDKPFPGRSAINTAHVLILYFTYSRRVRSPTAFFVVPVVQIENAIENDNPTGPCCASIESRFDGVIDRIVELDLALDGFIDMSPSEEDDPGDDARNNVDDETQEPRDYEVGSCPEEPSVNVISHISSVVGSVWFIVEDSDEDTSCYDEAGRDYGPYERRYKEG